MPRKINPANGRPRGGVRTAGATSGVHEPTPAERVAALVQQAAARGVEPIADFDRFLDEVGDAWPKDDNLDDFLGWLRRSRREGRY